MTDPIPLQEAQALVLARVRPLSSEPVPLAAAAGRVLAEPARAAVDLPPFPSSAMDGYALWSADTPGTLPVVFRIAAGAPSPRPLAPGEAMAISTGGVVPEGADAVVQHELVVETDNSLSVSEAVVSGSNVRSPGRDVAAGGVVVGAGARVGPAQVGALAAAGVASVVCARSPRVAVLTTGSELRTSGTPLGPGEIYESNGPMLAAQLAGAGAEVQLLGVVTDDEDAHRRAIEEGLGFDVLVTSGGVSVGPHDLVRTVERELGVEEVFWQVAVRPGKPVSFGVRDATLVFGLPGNPVSTLVACELFVLPALLALQGAAEPGPRFQVGRLEETVVRNPGRDDLLRARTIVTEDGVLLQPIGGQESHMIVSAAEADALAFVPRGEGTLEAGSTVRYLSI